MRAWLVERFSWVVLIGLLIQGAYAHMKDRPDLNDWFVSLHSKGGTWCCDFNEGTTLTTDQWGMEGDHYWVILDGQKMVVPDAAVIESPNKFGQAVVWPFGTEYEDDTNHSKVHIRCFLPGAGA